MKQYLVIGGIVLVIALGAIVTLRFLGGAEDAWICQNGEWVKHGNPDTAAPEGGCGATKQVTEQQTMEEPKTESTIVGSIKEAMELGKTMRCTYTSTEGGKTLQSSVVVSGEKFKAVSDMNGTKTNIIFDGASQYMWTDGTVQGLKMSKTCLDELKASIPTSDAATTSPLVQGPKDIEQSFETAVGTTCTVTVEEDFSVPSTVTFVDQCEMMKQSLDAMKSSKMQIPQGMTAPSTRAFPQ